MLLAAVQASALASDAQAAGDDVVCLLSLSELSARLHADRVDEAAHGLVLEGQLPPGDGRLALSPERGVSGAVEALGEIEIDHAAIDAAWVIRGDGPALLVSLQETLAPLASAAPHIEVDAERVRVRFAGAVPLVDLGLRVHQALAVWERVASFRLGGA